MVPCEEVKIKKQMFRHSAEICQTSFKLPLGVSNAVVTET